MDTNHTNANYVFGLYTPFKIQITYVKIRTGPFDTIIIVGIQGKRVQAVSLSTKNCNKLQKSQSKLFN